MKVILTRKGEEILVDDEDYEVLSQYVWHIERTGYAKRGFKIKGRCKSMLMHRQILGLEIGVKVDVDHINGNRRDNRRCNIRICTRAQNMCNREKLSNNTSGYKGVSLKDGSRWCAQIKINGRKKHIGCFDTPEQAHAAYCRAALEAHGEFANFGEWKEPDEIKGRAKALG